MTLLESLNDHQLLLFGCLLCVLLAVELVAIITIEHHEHLDRKDVSQ